MDMVRLGVDTFISGLADCVVSVDCRTEQNATIDRFEIYSDAAYILTNDCLYLCLDGKTPPCKHIEPGTAFIVNGEERVCPDPSCTRCDTICVNPQSVGRLVNQIAHALDRYRTLGRRIELASGDDALQGMLQAAEQMLGCPLCIYDINQDVLEVSDHHASINNPLWQTSVRDLKPSRCEIFDQCAGELVADDGPHSEHPAYPVSLGEWNMLAGNLFRRSRLVGTLWVFQDKPNRSFGPTQRYIFKWLVRQLNRWAKTSERLRTGRGIRSERFLFDVLEGRISEDSKIIAAGKIVGASVVESPEHQLLVMRPNRNVPQAERHMRLLNDLETAIPGCICALDDSTLMALIGIERNSYLDAQTVSAIDLICARSDSYAMLGAPYFRLSDTPHIARQLKEALSFIDPSVKGGKLHHYYDYSVPQSMHIVMRQQPVETLFHPIIRKLAAYDQECHTDYLDSLMVYLTYRCNISETSSVLHMHRNTLLNRIRRIEKIIGTTLDDWDLRRKLLFSFDYMLLSEGRPLLHGTGLSYIPNAHEGRASE